MGERCSVGCRHWQVQRFVRVQIPVHVVVCACVCGRLREWRTEKGIVSGQSERWVVERDACGRNNMVADSCKTHRRFYEHETSHG